MGLFGKKNKKTVGLDVGSGFVKLLEMDHSGDQPEVTRVAVRPVAPEAIVEGEVMDPMAVTETIRDLLEESGVDGRNVVAAVGGHDVIVKRIEMDRMEDAEAREVIRWEAEQHVPFDIESVELDFQVLDPAGGDPRMQVLLVAAKRELVESHAGLLEAAGASPRIIDAEAFALYNAFELNHPEALDGYVALVNVGHEVSNVNILENGIPALTRDVPFGTRKLREEVQRQRNLSSEEAEAFVQGENSMEDLDNFVRNSAEELAVGVERAAAFLMTEYAGASLGSVYLSGGGARIPGMADAVGERMGVETHGVNPFERVPIRPDAAPGLDIDRVASLLVLPVGLGLRRT